MVVKKSKRWALLACLVATAVVAGSVSIDGRTAPYRNLSNVRETSKGSEFEIRTAGLTQAAATYRLEHGGSTLPANSTFEMTWPDGTKDRAYVASPFGSMGSMPTPDSTCLTADDCGVNEQPK